MPPAVKREAMDGETFSSRWYDAARATPQPEIADEAPRTDVPEAINKLLTYCEHVLQQQLWLMPETNLHPEREDSLVHRVREMAPALAYVPASATRN